MIYRGFFLVVLAAACSVASAFRPAATTATQRSSSSSTALLDSVTPAGNKVPCFGAAPFLSDRSIFFGENYWNKLTMEWGTEDTGKFLRAAELKHGRSAMIATVGYAFEKFGLTFDKISPHEYLSVTQNIKFADLAAMSPINAALQIPAAGWAQIFVVIAAIEVYELTHANGAITYGESVAPGLQPGGLTGDLGWNPLQIKIDDRRRLVELQNGRAAMFAICAWVAAEAAPGSVPLPLLW